MGKKRLIMVNTYFQLLTAIRLRETIFIKDMVDIVISDQSRNSESVAKNLVTTNIFSNVIWIKDKKLCQDEKDKKARYLRWRYILCGINFQCVTTKQYDEIIYYNPDAFTYGVFSKLIESNPQLECSRYEEGILSYPDSIFLNNSKLQYTNLIRHFLRKKTLEDITEKFYCFYPDFYSGKHTPVQIPLIEDQKDIGEKLAMIFDVESAMLLIKEKYIFFTSVYDFEGGDPIGEYELVQSIANIVGKGNLLVKTHPRDTRTIYSDSGFHVYQYSSIPWEAIQLNIDLSEKILLTVNSSSALGANMITKNKAKALFMYECCSYKRNDAAISTVKEIERFINEMNGMIPNVLSVESLDEFSAIIFIEDKEN